MTAITTTTQLLSISIALIAAGSLSGTSFFEIPQLQAQPASRSLPSVRWYFSKGSHIFPQAASVSCAGFAYLAYQALPSSTRTVIQLLKLTSNGAKVNGYLAAAVLSIGVAPFTAIVMIPTNFALIKMNEEKGGFRSAESARRSTAKPDTRSAEESIDGKGEGGSQWTDLSGPQEKTNLDTTKEEDEKVRGLLSKFSNMNLVRAFLFGAAGLIGLWSALL